MSNPTSERAGPAAVDYIVIGAGPAGCAVAARLAQFSPDSRVALIEAGPAKASALSDVPLGIALLVPFRSQRNYAYETDAPGRFRRAQGLPAARPRPWRFEPDQRHDLYARPAAGLRFLGVARLQGLGMGGCVSLLQALRGQCAGPDEWHGVGGPLHVSDLAHRNPAVEAFVAAAVAGGIRAQRRLQRPGPGRRGRLSAVPEERPAVQRRAGLSPGVPRAQPRRLSPTARRGASCSTDKRAVGVVFSRGVVEERLDARREVILSAGAFGSPQLLMVSGLGRQRRSGASGSRSFTTRPTSAPNLQDHCDYVANLRAKGRACSASPGRC